MSDSENQFKVSKMFDPKTNRIHREAIIEQEANEDDDNSDTFYDALETIGQTATDIGIKIENDTDSLIDMYDEKFYVRLEQSFAKLKNDNNKSGTVKVKEGHETYSVITEISEIGHSAVSEPQQIKSIVSGSASTSGERKPNSQEFTSKQNFPAKKNSNETKKVVGEKADINRDAIGIYFERSPTCKIQ